MLQGKHVQLKPICIEDTKNILYWRNQPFVCNKFIIQEPFTRDIHERWLETMVDTGKVHQFIIYESVREIRPIGSVYLRDIDLGNRKAEFGIFIGEKECLGKGYGTEATELILKYAFQELGIHKVRLRVFASNEGAIECYKKAGFIQEGYFKDEVRIHDEYKDLIFMAAFGQ